MIDAKNSVWKWTADEVCVRNIEEEEEEEDGENSQLDDF